MLLAAPDKHVSFFSIPLKGDSLTCGLPISTLAHLPTPRRQNAHQDPGSRAVGNTGKANKRCVWDVEGPSRVLGQKTVNMGLEGDMSNLQVEKWV